MFDTIVLLTGPVEEAALSAVLRQHNPRLEIRSAKSREEMEALDPSTLARARLIAFVTPVVVPARILAALGFGAYNFTPARRIIRAGFHRILRSTKVRGLSARPPMR